MRIFVPLAIIALAVAAGMWSAHAKEQERKAELAALEKRNKEFVCKALVEAGLVRVCAVN